MLSMYDASLISDAPIRNLMAGDVLLGHAFKMRYPSYRGTYLSCIELLEIWVDGKPIDPESVYFFLNGKEFLLKEFPELYKEYWFRLTEAELRIYQSGTGGLAPGSKHLIKVHMIHRMPFAKYDGKNYMTLDSTFERELTVA